MSEPLLGVDAHAHVFARELAVVADRRYSPAYDAPLDAYLDHLRGQGLSHGVLVQPSFLGTDNGYLLDALAREPSRLRGVAVVAPGIEAGELQRMARLGIVGIRLNLIGKPLPALHEPGWRTLLEQVAALGWHVELHRQAVDIPALVDALRPFCCPVVVDHFGRPDATLGVRDAAFQSLLALDGGDVWVKVSGIYRLGGTPGQNLAFARDALALLVERFGSRRLLWGSDWPHTQHEDAMDYAAAFADLARLTDDPALRDDLLRRAPAELFGFDAGG